MRRSFSWALVIALLLRGLLGDALATEMAPLAVPSSPLNAYASMEHTPCASALIVSNALPAPCDEHPPNEHCSSCASCLSTWAPQPQPFALTPVIQRLAPIHLCMVLHSAPLRNLTKPPIAWA